MWAGCGVLQTMSVVSIFVKGLIIAQSFFFRDLKVTSLQALTQRLELAVAELKGRQGFACHFKQVR